MSQPFDPSGQQPNPWGATPAPQQGAPAAAAPPAGYPQQGYAPQQAQPAQQTQPGYAQQQGYAAPQQPGYNGVQQAWAGAPAAATPGPLSRLFDTAVTRLFSPGHLKGAMVLVYIVAGAVVLTNLVDAVLLFATYGGYGPSGAAVTRGIISILLAPVWGLGVLLVGRFAIELLTHVAALRTSAEASTPEKGEGA